MKSSETTPPVAPDVIDSGDKAAVKVTTSDLTTPQSISADAPQNPGNTPVVNQANGECCTQTEKKCNTHLWLCVRVGFHTI